ncbi:MAG: hypothetical protein Q9161_008067 [Pseudevernia consocians]
MTSAPTASTAPRSYANSVENDYPGEKYNWFLDMLRGRRPDVPVPFHQKRISTIRIVDDTGLTSRSEQFDALKGTEVSEDFVDALKRPITTTLAPIEYTAPLLQAAAIEFATGLDLWTEEILQETSGLENLPTILEMQTSSQMLECIIQNLSNSLSTAEWSQGSSTRTEQLLQEYIILLKSTISLGQHVKDLIQQEGSLQSIKETKKGLQQADSVRR